MAEFNLMQAVFDRSSLSPNEDVAVMTMHLRKHIAFAPDVGPIDNTLRTDFHNKFFAFWNIIKPFMSNKYTFRETRFYDVPASSGGDMGAPKMVNTVNIAATGTTNPLPPQCAVSVTFRTAERKRWGRFYIPGLTVAQIDSSGRLLTATADAIAAGAAPLCSRSGTGANLTIFSRTLWSDFDVQKVQVDDIIDVIRRRRFSDPHYRAAVTPS